MTDTSRPITGIIDQIGQSTAEQSVTLRHLLNAFGTASFLTSLCIPALLVITPLSGVPLFSSACGLLIAAIALQMLMGRSHLWLPGPIMRFSVSSDKASAGMKRLRVIGTRLDRYTRPRLAWLMTRPFRKVYQAFCMLCGAMMPMLELVPFSSSILGVATVFFATALMVHDGLLACLGTAAMLVALSLPLLVLQAV